MNKPDYIQLTLSILIGVALVPMLSNEMTPSNAFQALFFSILLVAYLAYKKDD